ncbi:DUF4388 domain-containing protein [Vitiosangium sp. GDMCC 1.1324]|uniref:DUF4388 domain-containing protein n=1 Tax=Vitiosangium sp. (strain GDMCC 1.1324) TaxID=2138576 RepID=UPI000D3A431E|nr:DUF4388 domain-containing protein [Vitiosangium sp. GDMCC 1.1324]PTL85787.1 DUF4388 domain-containing protein [Vitiosangium sp. GDMCC 1.1324]
MDRFKGNLASYRLQLLMPAFFEAPAVDGMLRVERGAVRRHFFFQRGLLVGESSSEPREHLGQVLARLRILDAERAAEAFEAAEAAEVPFGTFVVERGLVARARLQEALEHKAREALFDCYGWESGEVEFRPGLPPLGRAVELQLGLKELHRDALTRLLEWKVFWDLFPGPGTTFGVYREFAVETVSAAEEQLLQLAETGATLSELLAASPEGPLHGARWVLRLYRRGALTPRKTRGPKVGETTALADLLELARGLVETERYEEAVAVAGQVLERAPVPEAHALYRETEVRLTVALADEVLALDGKMYFEPLPRPIPPSLTADDLYLYAKLRGSRSVREVLRNAAMGELAAYRALRRLMDAGIAKVMPDNTAPGRKAKTDPYGIPVVVL